MARPGGSRVLRLIGGTWRGRKIQFPPVEGIRPTPDRIRETLFNWLAPVIHDARCLDLFAGSGAIGFEALSRGAAQVVMVEREHRVADYLRQTGAELGPESRLRVVQADALKLLAAGRPAETEAFDIVFLDPPFRRDLLSGALDALSEGNWLAPGAVVYAEAEKELGEPALPRGWTLRRRKESGQVAYHLIDTA
ncbi:MAG: 16S rRNA (guanine(966)-N(2))-methyltransferase RsmD [Gammaproteobacteria bacterium]|nr:16S rRNA (guanine(966)-N(2))-methyltransferase RsmD [Gammaproteobacteria bacterium]